MPLDPSLTEFSTTSPILVTFSNTEIITAQGILKLYLYTTNDDASPTVERLTTNPNWYSWNKERNSADNYDSDAFPEQRVISGVAHANIGIECAGVATISVRLYKWDGSTATAITENHTVSFGGAATVTTSISMPCTETVLRRGEQLRVTIGLSGSIFFGTDPRNRDATNLKPASEAVITNSYVEVPFQTQ